MHLTATAPITVRELEQQGFSAAAITRLQQLKANYDPCREHCESNREHGQLCFLKWRYAQGEITETTTA
jgi:hypothetical protein